MTHKGTLTCNRCVIANRVMFSLYIAPLFALFLALTPGALAVEGKPAASAQSNNAADISDPEQHRKSVLEMLGQNNFDQLDATATAERLGKKRFPGGVWKLHDTYREISSPYIPDGSDPTDADWQSLLAKLQRWVSQNPNSITARIALAQAYHNYAWAARGTEESDLVKKGSWDPFAQRLQIARNTLEKASTLSDKCPQWFVVMVWIARAQQWNLDDQRALVERAMKFEPLYYYYYQDFAFTLQPRWYGEVGDSEKFAGEVATRIGGKQGAAIYFEIAIVLNCIGCSEGEQRFKLMDWEKIQQGYAADVELYGESNYKLNEFAHLAVRANDHDVALQAFLHIRNNWDEEVWHERKYFESARLWALAMPPDFSDALKAAFGHFRMSEGPVYQQQFAADFHSSYDAAVKQCSDTDKYDEGGFTLAARVGSQGAIEQTIPWPPTELSRCIIPKLAGHHFPTPPQPSYWVTFNIGTMTPVRPDYQGPVVPDVAK